MEYDEKEKNQSELINYSAQIDSHENKTFIMNGHGNFFNDLLGKISEGLIIYDDCNGILYVNLPASSLLGKDYKDIHGRDIQDFIAADHHDVFRKKTGSPEDEKFEIELFHNSKSKIPVNVKCGEIIYHGKKLRYITILNITQNKNYKDIAMESGKKFRTLIKNSSDVIMVLDNEGQFEYSSDNIENILGYSPYEKIGQNASAFIHPDDLYNVVRKFSGNQKTGNRADSLEFRYRHKNGTWRNVESAVWNLLYDPLINGILLNIKDVTGRRVAEEQAAYFQLYDSEITLLPNIGFFRNRVRMEIVKIKERKKNNIIAVMSIGIDRFKNINNLHGPAAGDELLEKVGRRLKSSLRGDDLVARFSGDVFIVLLSYVARPFDFKDIIKKITGIFSEPVKIKDRMIDITVSIGMGVFPNDGNDADTIINNSQAAMYNAKQAGGNTYSFFDSQIHDNLINNLQLEEELKDALKNNEFVLYYQPKFNRKNKLVGVESLVRWVTAKRGLVPPNDFIPLVEKNGMIIDIGYEIFRKACLQCRDWSEQGHDINVAINFAPVQFNDPNLMRNIKIIIEETGVDAGLLEFEITETGIMRNEKEGLNKLHEINKMGIKIAMDDFGKGLSSLSNLIAYPIDTLKIDKSFVDDIPVNKDVMNVVNTILQLASSLGFEVVAEGVENIEQLDYLKKKGCDKFQGYYFSKPLELREFDEKFVK